MEETFGSPDQRRLQRRAEMLWRLLGDDPRYASHGRGVMLADPGSGTVAHQAALARLAGASACGGVPAADAAGRRRALEAEGLTTDAYVEWVGEASAFAAAEAAAAERALPADLSLTEIDGRTPHATLEALDALTAACGVLLPTGSFVRGLRRPAVCLLARDAAGRAVGASAAVMQFHPDHPLGRRAWWGMLATRESRRGEGVALVMGALSMRAIRDRHGAESVFTGVRAGNAPSEALCRRLGLAPCGTEMVVSIDPEGFGAERVTT